MFRWGGLFFTPMCWLTEDSDVGAVLVYNEVDGGAAAVLAGYTTGPLTTVRGHGI